MKKLFILKAVDSKNMESIASDLQENKFKVLQSDNKFILMRKKRYGNTVIQLGCLFFALFFFYPLILVNLVYFTYSLLWNSPNVLITTEKKDAEGNNLEYNTIEEVLEKANAVL